MFNLYPYTDFHELNLDMILRMMKDLHKEWTDFEAVNKITNAGAWDITKQYQAWTVVSDNNIGYISLKPVPVGVAITNTEYWGVIADYDILITDLSARISALENTVNNITTVQIPTINEKLDHIKDRYFVLISDSYGGVQDGDGHTFLDLIVAMLNINSDHYFAVSVAGAGFTQPHGDSKEFDYILMNNVPESWRAKATDIYVFGGANDVGVADTYTAIQNGINYFMYDARDYFPNAHVYLACIGYEIDSLADIAYRQNQTIGAYRDCAKLGAGYLHGSEYIMSDTSFFAADGIHPNNDGVHALAVNLSQCVLTGACTFTSMISITGTVKLIDNTTHSFTHTERREGDKFRFGEGRESISIQTAAQNISISDTVKGHSIELPRSLIMPDATTTEFLEGFNAAVGIYGSGNSYTLVPIRVWLTDLNVNGAIYAFQYLAKVDITGAYSYTFYL